MGVEESIEVLRHALSTDDCVLYVGNGLAIEAGYRPFSRFASDFVGARGFTLHEGVDYEEIADLVRVIASPEELYREIQEQFAAADRVSSPLMALADLPFAGIATTIWSPLVVEAFGSRGLEVLWPGADSADNRGGEAERPLCQLFGFAPVPNEVRLSWGEYDDAVRSDPAFQRRLQELAEKRTWLFVGASVSTIRIAIRRLRLQRDAPARHFAIPTHRGLTSTDRAVLEAFGVTVLPHLQQDLENFADAIRPRPQAAAARYVDRPRVEGLFLENIGGFQEHYMQFDGRNIVLVGDNASGKTTALRALAVALSGTNETPSDVGRALLRVGHSRARIGLVLDGERYTTHLFETPEGTGVESPRITPVQTGGVIALGFSTPRGVASGNRYGPRPLTDFHASTVDLKPLANTTIDTRIDDVEQWIINTIVQGGRSALPLLRRYFSLLSDLTPGAEYSLGSVDLETWEVVLDTPDGSLRLDQLSSGMLSVMGWVGVVLERLFRAFPDSEAPERSPCILLVDEIDLHLHPAWQRRILPALCSTFPEAQLIVSTHSPLVVGSVDPETYVFELSRNTEGVVSQRLDEPFSRRRTDQILTGPAFNLDSTLSRASEQALNDISLGLEQARQKGDADEVARLAELVHTFMPPPSDSPAEQAGQRMVREALETQIRSAPADERVRVAAEAVAYLRKLNGDTQ